MAMSPYLDHLRTRRRSARPASRGGSTDVVLSGWQCRGVVNEPRHPELVPELRRDRDAHRLAVGIGLLRRARPGDHGGNDAWRSTELQCNGAQIDAELV